MVGQCPVCKGYFGIQQEWVGQEAQCPHCQQTITVQTVETSGKDLSTETKKTNVLSLVLLIIGIIIYCGNYLASIANRIYIANRFLSFYTFQKLWHNGLCLLVPIIGCIVSIFYFINSNKYKKIQWEYFGIVSSFMTVISFLIYKLIWIGVEF